MIVNLKSQKQPLVTRFAPSPTGYLHIGHIASMAFVYGIARAAGARLLLRIEDHDRGRCRPEYEQAIYDDLNWLGFEFDDQPVAGKSHNLRQSNRLERYQQLSEELTRTKQAYRCICTRAEIQQKMQPGQDNQPVPAEELFYSGTCRSSDHSRLAEGFGIRLQVNERNYEFFDGLLGSQIQHPFSQCGDFLIRDRHGNYTYQFAVSVDDMDQGINLVIRGEDILHATGRQLLTAEKLGRSSSLQFVHHPLLNDENGRKLSKRFFSEAVAKKRADGTDPQLLLGMALTHAGLLEKAEPIRPEDTAALFDVRITNDPS